MLGKRKTKFIKLFKNFELSVYLNPRDDALEDLLLARHGDGVAGDEASHLVGGQTEELVTLKHLDDQDVRYFCYYFTISTRTDLCEVPLYVGLCTAEELETAVKVCEGADTEAVGGMQLRLKELAASVSEVIEN